ARTSLAAISVSIASPAPNALVADRLDVNVSVSSTYAVQSVRAEVLGIVDDLGFAGGSWWGALSLGSLPFGPCTLTVTATDLVGNTGTAQVQVSHNAPPSLTFSGPIDGSVVRATVPIHVVCTDDNPAECSATQVVAGPLQMTVASGQGRIDLDALSLAAFD